MKNTAFTNSTHSIFNMSKKILLFTTLVFLLNSCAVEIRIDGCTDPVAVNYDPQADGDDGSCLYTIGCTDPAAINYDPQAILDDGSCLYISGCTDPAAINYDWQAGIEPLNACEYTCDVVYYLDYAASQYMINWGISYYSFYDFSGSWIGDITNDAWWSSPPNCSPQTDGSTLTASLYWYGNYGSNTATYSFSAYPDDGPIPDYDGTFVVYPNECIRVELTQQQIQDYKDSH